MDQKIKKPKQNKLKRKPRERIKEITSDNDDYKMDGWSQSEALDSGIKSLKKESVDF